MDKNINIIPHDECTGCGACMNKCPKNAITMKYDSEGFLYPHINNDCINCGLCLKVCPTINGQDFYKTPKSYAVWANDAIRMESSSGGMFTLMANYVIENGGVVFGAVFSEDWKTVHHTWVKSKEALSALRGSKYVQSDIKNSYREAKEFLEKGKMVLFTASPCQIAGLYTYLGKIYENLFTADFICHGSNSVTAYQSFLNEFTEGKSIKKVAFRDKRMFKWLTSFVVYFNDGSVKKDIRNKRLWYKGFLNGVINRLCCYKCVYAKSERISDITLGDCWRVGRIDKNCDDGQGTSLILVNSDKGKLLMNLLNKEMKLCKEIPLNEIRKYNGQLNRPSTKHESRNIFFSHLDKLGYNTSLKYAFGEKFDIGIVGWWFAYNYGSALTYFALGTILKQLGKQVLYIPVARLNGSSLSKENKEIVSFIAKYFHVGAIKDFDKMDEFNSICDAFILGSDQMWRANTINSVGYSFYLDFVDKDKKKIAFSTSFGVDYFDGSKITCDTVKDFLKRFDAISVREKSGVSICKEKFNIDVQQIIDPIFLLNKDDYNQITNDVKLETPNKNYLLCYILDPTPEKEIAAKNIAAHKNLEIKVIFGIREYNESKKNWKIGEILPKLNIQEFMFYIKNSSFIMTDSHRGTCLAIIEQKDYVAIVNSRRGATRFETIADLLGLNNRLVYKPETLQESEEIYKNIEWEEVGKHIEYEKEKAILWLKEALLKETKISEDTFNTLRVDNERKYFGLNLRLKRLNKKIDQKQVNNNKGIKYIISKISGGLKCYKEHGFKYTLNRIIFKIKNR